MKSYPRSQFEVVNNTSVEEIATNTVSGTTSIMMAAYTSDKGSEDWELLYGLSNFTDRKGGLSFSKHGQAQFTVASLLTNGSYVLAKRMVSKDATLANVTIRAKVVVVDNISYLYLYGTSAQNKTLFNEVCEAGYDSFDADAEPVSGTAGEDNQKQSKTYDIPLFTVAAVGRGTSAITIRLIPEYFASKSGDNMKYTFEVSENVQVLESITCTFNPDVVLDGTIQSIQNKVNKASGQVKAKIYEDGILKLVQILATTATKQVNKVVIKPEGGKEIVQETQNIPISELVNLDFINGYDKKESPIAGIITKNISDAGKDQQNLWTSYKPSDVDTAFTLNVAEGIKLTNGSNGAMGVAPVQNAEEYKKMLLGTFGKNTSDNNFSPIIYDLDRYKVDAIFDCNFDMEVKNALVDLVDFRGDCVFLAVLGIGLSDLDTIINKSTEITPSKYVAIYHNSFDIIDQFTKKQITVTMPYLLASKLINHISTGVGKAFAGIPNNLTFPEIIEGTLNFLPVIIPGLDQKQKLADANINYLSYYDELPVMESMWTNDNTYTQLSFLHNVMAVQEIIKIIRTRCPKTRYTFLDGDDLEEYLSDANSIIKEYKNNFKSISLTYMADEKYESNNIFYATITVVFHNFVNEEYFKVICID